MNTPEGLLGKADAIGYAVCHRIDARSFHLGERQLSLCARCSGMFLGALLGLAYLARFRPRRGGMPSRSIWFIFGVFVLAFGVDGVNSYLHLFPLGLGVYEPQNWLRLLTGTGMGLVLAGVLFPAYNQTMWRDWDRRPVMQSPVAMLPLLALALGLDGLVLNENPLLLYPLALLSALSVLVLLSMVYAMLWMMVLRMENRFSQASQLWFPLVMGFGTGLLQIIVLDYVRYLLTGTWDGFHLG
ncbi:MAG: DUF2085 domain-containing protein [Chloroflexota bacterium]